MISYIIGLASRVFVRFVPISKLIERSFLNSQRMIVVIISAIGITASVLP